MLPLNTDARSIVIMDPQSGETGLGDVDFSQEMPRVRVQLASGEALILRTYQEEASGIDPWKY